MSAISHGFEPIVGISRLNEYKSVVSSSVLVRIGILKPVLVSSQVTFDMKRMIETSREVTNWNNMCELVHVWEYDARCLENSATTYSKVQLVPEFRSPKIEICVIGSTRVESFTTSTDADCCLRREELAKGVPWGLSSFGAPSIAVSWCWHCSQLSRATKAKSISSVISACFRYILEIIIVSKWVCIALAFASCCTILNWWPHNSPTSTCSPWFQFWILCASVATPTLFVGASIAML